MNSFVTCRLAAAPDDMASDGSEERHLAQASRGSMAQFTLAPGAVSRAVARRTVEEVWLFTEGRGRLWRRLGALEETIEVSEGVSISIPVGASFQFRCDGNEPLKAVAVTMPPWPGEGEAHAVDGIWLATV